MRAPILILLLFWLYAQTSGNDIGKWMMKITDDKENSAQNIEPMIRKENGKAVRYTIGEDKPFLGSVQDRIERVNGHSAATPNIDDTKKTHLLHVINKNNHFKNDNKKMETANFNNAKSKSPRKKLRYEIKDAKSNKENNRFIKPKNGHSGKEGTCKKDFPIANCSNLNLDKVPQDLPPVITTLILSHNNLNTNSLSNAPFRRYGQLKYLLLDFNHISSLPDNAFKGLNNLDTLNLHSNNIIMTSAFNNTGAFIPLKNSLYKLVINNNTKDVNAPGLIYPDKALSYLANLHTLEIDGLPNTAFGYHFQFLTNLTTLSLEGYYTGKCNLSSFHNNTFKYLPRVRNLIIADCNIYKNRTDISALEPLTQLEYLDVSYNFDLGLDGLGKLMYGQRNNQNLKRITLKYIVQRYEPCIILYKDTLKNFRNLSLEIIEANHNNMEMIEYGAIDYLPKTLKRINMTRNNIMFGAYWRHLKELTSLESLDLDGYDKAYRLPPQPPPENIHCPLHNEGYEGHRTQKKSLEQFWDTPGPLFLQLPPNLKNLTMRSYSMSYKIDAMAFDPNNTLTNVDLHGNYFPLLNGPISGLDSLKNLDISSCFVREIDSKFFRNLKSLTKVNLYDNRLGDSLAKRSTIFDSDTLEHLNIGANSIYKLNDEVFKDCSNLTTLILSDNRVRMINSALDNLPKLSSLFLTQNDLNTLPKTLRDHFSGMGSHAFVDMTFNPIYCDCSNIDFLEWVVNTKIFGNNYTNYYCAYPSDNSMRKLMDKGYDEELKLLMNQCADNTKLFICVISATVAFFLILIGVIMYRFRWTMRYWYYVAKYMLSNKSNNTDKDEFEYDLFVCYCPQDNNFITEELETRLGQERNMKLLLQDKCFQAGHEIAENILMAVRQSRKTLVVMSKAMLDSAWCNYDLEMARQESTSTGRTVLVIMFLEKIPKATMSLDMINYIKSNVIVTYPTANADLQEEFWDRLAQDLKSS